MHQKANKNRETFKTIMLEQKLSKKQKKTRLFQVIDLKSDAAAKIRATVGDPAYIPEDVINAVRAHEAKNQYSMIRSRSEKSFDASKSLN